MKQQLTAWSGGLKTTISNAQVNDTLSARSQRLHELEATLAAETVATAKYRKMVRCAWLLDVGHGLVGSLAALHGLPCRTAYAEKVPLRYFICRWARLAS